jgi:hypothetical protein
MDDRLCEIFIAIRRWSGSNAEAPEACCDGGVIMHTGALCMFCYLTFIYL